MGRKSVLIALNQNSNIGWGLLLFFLDQSLPLYQKSVKCNFPLNSLNLIILRQTAVSDERVRRSILHTFQSKFDLFFKDEIGHENIGNDGLDHNKLRFYRTFKSCFKPEFYIENVHNRNQIAHLLP